MLNEQIAKVDAGEDLLQEEMATAICRRNNRQEKFSTVQEKGEARDEEEEVPVK